MNYIKQLLKTFCEKLNMEYSYVWFWNIECFGKSNVVVKPLIFSIREDYWKLQRKAVRNEHILESGKKEKRCQEIQIKIN